MSGITIDPIIIQIGGPALLAGLLLGAIVVWLLQRHRQEYVVGRTPAPAPHEPPMDLARRLFSGLRVPAFGGHFNGGRLFRFPCFFFRLHLVRSRYR